MDDIAGSQRWVRFARSLLADGHAHAVAMAWVLGADNARLFAQRLLKTEEIVGQVDAVACHKAAMLLISVVEALF